MKRWKMMNIEWLPSKTNYTPEFSILRLRENTSFHKFTGCLGGYNNFEASFQSMENQRNSLNNNEKMKDDEHKVIAIKHKLHQWILHTQIKGGDYNNFQPSLYSMENQRNSLNNNEKMKHVEHRVITIKNK